MSVRKEHLERSTQTPAQGGSSTQPSTQASTQGGSSTHPSTNESPTLP